MYVIGLTGGVGAGKSVVLHMLQEHFGAYIISADAVGAELMKKGGATYLSLVQEFGEEILDEQGEIDKKRLAAVGFASEENHLRLNASTHPIIREAIVQEIAHAKSQYELLVIESAIIVQGKLDVLCDAIWYVHVPWEVRRQRIMESRGYSLERAEGIMRNQWTEEQFMELADVVIENDGSIENTYEQVEAAVAGLNLMEDTPEQNNLS